MEELYWRGRKAVEGMLEGRQGKGVLGEEEGK